jgi:hypothetical protein
MVRRTSTAGVAPGDALAEGAADGADEAGSDVAEGELDGWEALGAGDGPFADGRQPARTAAPAAAAAPRNRRLVSSGSGITP